MKKIIIIVTVLIVIIGAGAFLLGKKSNDKIPEPVTEEKQKIDTTVVETSVEQLGDKEEASGIVKSVYNKNGKNYLDIDYIELNSNWAPGGGHGSPYQNNNPKIRTFEISSSAQFFVGSPATNLVSFSDFEKYFVEGFLNYQKNNPWDIVIVNGIVIQAKEHFLP